MCFTVTVRTKKFAIKQNQKYSAEEAKLFLKIKSLHQSGLGYRKIVHKLNAENITTHKGKKYESNNVYSILKRHKEREEQLMFLNKENRLVWGKMIITSEKGI